MQQEGGSKKGVVVMPSLLDLKEMAYLVTVSVLGVLFYAFLLRRLAQITIKKSIMLLDVLCFTALMLIAVRLDKLLNLHGDLKDSVLLVFIFLGVCATESGRWVRQAAAQPSEFKK